MSWEFQEHQVEGGTWILNSLRTIGWAYLAWEERTRKTGTIINAVERSKAKKCLILTTNKAVPGIKEHLKELPITKKYVVFNYDKIILRKDEDGKKIETVVRCARRLMREYRMSTRDIVWLDEAHTNISSIGSPTDRQKVVRYLCKGLPVIFSSATPYAEHVGLLYHQLQMSSWSPFKGFNTFSAFYKRFGIPKLVRTPYGLKDSKTNYRSEEVLKLAFTGLNFKTRAELGFEHEPETNVIIVDLHKDTKAMIESLKEYGVLNVSNTLVYADSDSKKRAMHYQLESGTLKVNDNESIRLPYHEKLNYCRKNYDKKKTAIMCHFIEERKMYEEDGWDVYSSDGHAEGVNLSHIEKLVVTSMSFRTSKARQRKARQADKDRKTPIVVDILVSKSPAIGMSVYDTVYVKELNFVRDSYEKACNG